MTHETYDLKLDPESLEDSIPGHFTVIVHNKGQLELSIELFASDERQRARYELMPCSLRVAPGAKAKSHLLVVPTDISAFLQAIQFTVQDSFGKSVKGEYTAEFEDEDEDDSSEEKSEREQRSSEQRTRVEERQRRSIRERQRDVGRSIQPRQKASFGGRGSGMSLPVDTTIRVLMRMAASLLIFLVVTIGIWWWPTPSFVMSEVPAATETIEASITKQSVAIPSPTVPPIPTATPLSIPTVTLRAGGNQTQTPTNIPVKPVEGSFSPTNTAEANFSPTNTAEASTPTNQTRLATLTPTKTPEASLTPTNTPEASLTPTNTPLRASLTPTNTPTYTTTPSTNTPTLTAVPPTHTATSVPPTQTATSVPSTATPSLTPQLRLPDLMITSLEVTGSPKQNNDGAFQVPILVIIQNQGEAESHIFKVSVEVTQFEETIVVPFTVKGQSSIWYPFTSAPLMGGSRVIFEGSVTLNNTPSGEHLTITAIADSCSGEELTSDYCRIEESNEQNNRSAPASINLP